MRQLVSRTISVVLMLVTFLPFTFAQTGSAKKAVANRRTNPETVLTAEEGPAVKAQPSTRKGRLAPTVKGKDEDDDGDAKAPDMPAFHVMSHPKEHRLV